MIHILFFKRKKKKSFLMKNKCKNKIIGFWRFALATGVWLHRQAASRMREWVTLPTKHMTIYGSNRKRGIW